MFAYAYDGEFFHNEGSYRPTLYPVGGLWVGAAVYSNATTITYTVKEIEGNMARLEALRMEAE